MSDIIFRLADESDRESFLEMAREFYSSEAVLGDIPEAYHVNAFNEAMRSGDYLVLYIFDCLGKSAGYGLLNKMFTHESGGLTLWIEELYVRAQYQGNGAGNKFLKFVEESYPANRYRLETEPDNLRAAKLYERLGYKKLDYVSMIKDSE